MVADFSGLFLICKSTSAAFTLDNTGIKFFARKAFPRNTIDFAPLLYLVF